MLKTLKMYLLWYYQYYVELQMYKRCPKFAAAYNKKLIHFELSTNSNKPNINRYIRHISTPMLGTFNVGPPKPSLIGFLSDVKSNKLIKQVKKQIKLEETK